MSGIICNAGGTAGIHVPSRRYSNDEDLRGGIFRFPSISAPRADEGKDKVIGFLMGQLMREMKGKAAPSQAQEAIRKILSAY